MRGARAAVLLDAGATQRQGEDVVKPVLITGR